jgi:uncharacterized membrane protein YjjP (DUF1212 family)
VTDKSSSSDETPTPSARARTREEVADYLLDIGATLAAYGCPSYRIEDVIRLIADVEGFRADPFALPTGLFLRVTGMDGFGPQVHRMTRVVESGVDLTRLTVIDQIFNDVIERKSTIEQARARIRECMAGPPEWSPALVFMATVVVSGASAVFFQGGALEVLVAAIVGAVIAGGRRALTITSSSSSSSSSNKMLGFGFGFGALPTATKEEPKENAVVLSARRNSRRLLGDFLGGLFTAACAGLALRVWPETRPEVIVPAGAIALFPGMTFTTGVAEVAQKNLVSGGARLIDSAVTLLLILFGVALVSGLQGVAGVHAPEWLGGTGAAAARPGLALPYHALALLASSVAFGALFQIPRRWLWAALVSSMTGWGVATFAVRHHVPGHVTAFLAALAVCVVSNGLARATNRPSQLFQLPGMMLLVPGSFGFLSLGEFLENDTTHGLQRGFTMALVGAALVIGVLVANVIAPARKLL